MVRIVRELPFKYLRFSSVDLNYIYLSQSMSSLKFAGSGLISCAYRSQRLFNALVVPGNSSGLASKALMRNRASNMEAYEIPICLAAQIGFAPALMYLMARRVFAIVRARLPLSKIGESQPCVQAYRISV